MARSPTRLGKNLKPALDPREEEEIEMNRKHLLKVRQSQEKIDSIENL